MKIRWVNGVRTGEPNVNPDLKMKVQKVRGDGRTGGKRPPVGEWEMGILNPFPASVFYQVYGKNALHVILPIPAIAFLTERTNTHMFNLSTCIPEL